MTLIVRRIDKRERLACNGHQLPSPLLEHKAHCSHEAFYAVDMAFYTAAPEVDELAALGIVSADLETEMAAL